MTWTVGVAKLGSDPKPPSPGSVTRIHVENYVGDELMGTFDAIWDGYTPQEVKANRIKRWREAHARHEADGLTLTYWSADDRWQRLTLSALL